MKALAPHSSALAWRTPWTEEPGGLRSMVLLWVRLDWATSLSLFTFMHWGRKWQPTPVFLPGESQGRESLAGCRLGVAQSQTRLKRLSSSSSSCRWIDKCNAVCVCNEMLLSHKKEAYPAIWNSVYGPWLYEISQAEKERCCMISFLCGI